MVDRSAIWAALAMPILIGFLLASFSVSELRAAPKDIVMDIVKGIGWFPTIAYVFSFILMAVTCTAHASWGRCATRPGGGRARTYQPN